MIGYLGEIINGQDDAAMAIIDAALSGTSGRLFIELREKQGLAYSVYSFRRPGLETGMFGVYLACDPEKLRIAKESIFNELNKMRDEGLTNRELEDAKRYITGKDAINSQTNQSGAMRMALDEIYGLGYEHKKEYIKRIQAVTVEDILRAAKRIIHPDHYVLVTLGPGS
ncbi:MAG: insulinase family protein, partial [Deltaproteobacteria bacterium]|nr:insulinase family protein [Deltaproteobacteria bacterium]